MNTRDLLIMVIAIEIGLHYFPWRLALGRKLPRLAAYTLGLLGMMGPLSAWLMDRGLYEIMQVLWMVVVAAGLTVFAVYGFDHYLELSRRSVEAEQREQLLRELADGKANQD